MEQKNLDWLLAQLQDEDIRISDEHADVFMSICTTETQTKEVARVFGAAVPAARVSFLNYLVVQKKWTYVKESPVDKGDGSVSDEEEDPPYTPKDIPALAISLLKVLKGLQQEANKPFNVERIRYVERKLKEAIGWATDIEQAADTLLNTDEKRGLQMDLAIHDLVYAVNRAAKIDHTHVTMFETFMQSVTEEEMPAVLDDLKQHLRDDRLAVLQSMAQE